MLFIIFLFVIFEFLKMNKMFYEKNKVLSECYNTLPPRNKK